MKNKIKSVIHEFGLIKSFKKLVISLLFCDFIVDYQ